MAGRLAELRVALVICGAVMQHNDAAQWSWMVRAMMV
jgi:hypothetical protein